MLEFKLPSLGAEMDEGTLLEWRVQPGDAVKKGDVIAVVDTSKSAIDVEIWQDGVIYELAAQPQQTLPVGTVIARLLEPGETPEHAEAQKRERAAAAPAPAPTPRAPAIGSAPPPGAAAAAAEAAARRRVSPAARARAQASGVDLAKLAGSGPAGAITLQDVEAAAKPRGPVDRALAMRTAIAAAMARSKREIPHYYLATDIVLTRATQWLGVRNANRTLTERVLLAALLLKAVALALRKFPELNGHHRDGVFVPGSGIHVGVAISLRQGGLIAPALHDVDRLSIDELMRQLADLVARARALTLRSSEMMDATVTVTNLGDQGVRLVEGVIYPPQVALVGFGSVADRPWVDNGSLVIAPVVTASLSADHRASDGHRGALFLNELDRLLQQPENLEEASA